MPRCWIIAGPNGAGKTTFALDFLPTVAGCLSFINADLIAAGLSPLAPASSRVAASRLFLEAIRAASGKEEDFSFETTLAGRGHLRLIEQLTTVGWQVELVYLALPSVELSRLRVAERVAHGGHHISNRDIVRRFPRSLHNLLGAYGKAASRTRCYMNDSETPTPVFEQIGEQITIYDASAYVLLEKESLR